jgi:hypothetical protein
LRRTTVKNGTVRLAAVTNMRDAWRTSAVVSAARADHEAGRVAERDDGQVEGVAELHEARRLVGGVGVDGAGQVERVVGDDADGRPSMRASAVTIAAPNSRRSSSTLPSSARSSMIGATR